jgi:hypothetical protein
MKKEQVFFEDTQFVGSEVDFEKYGKGIMWIVQDEIVTRK